MAPILSSSYLFLIHLFTQMKSLKYFFFFYRSFAISQKIFNLHLQASRRETGYRKPFVFSVQTREWCCPRSFESLQIFQWKHPRNIWNVQHWPSARHRDWFCKVHFASSCTKMLHKFHITRDNRYFDKSK